MADGTTSRVRIAVIAVLALLVVVVTGLAFVLGRQNAVQEAANRIVQHVVARFEARRPSRKFGNWILNCAVDNEHIEHCGLVFQAVDNTRKHILLRLSLIRASNGEVVMLILTPPDAVAARGIKFTPGAGPPIAIPISRCLPRGCDALLTLTDPLLGALRATDKVQVNFVGHSRPVSYVLPIDGFANGYAAWQSEDRRAIGSRRAGP